VSIDPKVKEAIKKVVSDEGQPEKLSKRLIAWLDAMSDTDHSSEKNSEHLEFVHAAIATNSGGRS